MKIRDDKFTVEKHSTWPHKNWTVWLPEGRRWIQNGDGSIIMTAQGAGGFKTYEEARQYLLTRMD